MRDDDGFWRAVLGDAGIPSGVTPDDGLPLRALAGDDLGLLRLWCAVEDRLPGGLPTDLLEVLEVFGDLAHFVAVRRGHDDACDPAGAR